MKTTTVFIRYDGSPVLAVDPPVVLVDLGDTIEFKREDPSPRVGKFRLRFLEKQFFHTEMGSWPNTATSTKTMDSFASGTCSTSQRTTANCGTEIA